NFRWRMPQIEAIVSADRLSAVGMGVFDSDGFNPDGSRFDRRGRATIAFARKAVGQPWIAVHTHMSLFRGTPDRSHGKFGCFSPGVRVTVTITITAFERSPDGGRGLARDTRVRWALEEVGQPYEVRLVSFRAMKESAHLALHPFGQIPTYEEGELA